MNMFILELNELGKVQTRATAKALGHMLEMLTLQPLTNQGWLSREDGARPSLRLAVFCGGGLTKRPPVATYKLSYATILSKLFKFRAQSFGI